jgi:glyoxylase-like metal-dependent hydrolase (beta-lactamase superfamily II)
MRGKILITLMLVCPTAATQDARGILAATIKSIGDVKSIQYSGSGAQFAIGQSMSATSPGSRVEIKSFIRTVDYDKQASRNETSFRVARELTMAGSQAPVSVQLAVGDKAWGQVGVNATPALPAVAAERQLQIWLTPHGFVKAALANKATVKRGEATLVTFMAQGKYRVTGTISTDYLVEKVESWLANPVLGDMPVVTTYSDYRDFGGFRFPTKLVQQQGGFPVFELTVTAAQANVPLDLTVPDSVRQAMPPPVRVTSEKLSDGVWYLTGGSHHSLAVEFADHVAVIEAPLNEERSTAVIAEIKKLIPAKPIRYLVNTHHHFDHSGGLRTYVAEGTTIVTHESNKAFYQETFKAPRTLAPDRQAREKRNAEILAIGAKHVLSDGTRTVEIHHIQGNLHDAGLIMAYLPKEKLLVEADVYSGPDPRPNPRPVNLYENIQRLNLNVDQIAPLHGRLSTIEELRKTVGK